MMWDSIREPRHTEIECQKGKQSSTLYCNVLEGISLAHDLVTALPVAVRVVHAMSEIGTSVI